MAALSRPSAASVACRQGSGYFGARLALRAPALRPRARLVALRPSASVSEVGRYLSEAASSIFSPQASDVPWEGSASGFTGGIVHHEEKTRLRQLAEEVSAARQQLEGCMDPSATNYNPQANQEDGSCVYSFDGQGTFVVGEEGSAGEFVRSSIERVFGNNFTGDASEPKVWTSGGYAASGRHRTQRDLRHEYDRLQRFEGLLRQTLKDAEARERDT